MSQLDPATWAYVVSTNWFEPSMWSFDFNNRDDAEFFAASITRGADVVYEALEKPEDSPNPRGLLLYVLVSKETGVYEVVCAYVAGESLAFEELREDEPPVRRGPLLGLAGLLQNPKEARTREINRVLRQRAVQASADGRKADFIKRFLPKVDTSL